MDIDEIILVLSPLHWFRLSFFYVCTNPRASDCSGNPFRREKIFVTNQIGKIGAESAVKP